ncbi:MAG: hypothetical protein K6B14_02235 [Lachnospiraceae bacterium]|nr:hypothetical protein [Lachnospiraceae bacterium]
MNVFEISDDNIVDFADILGEDMMEDMERTFYRGYGTSDDDGNINGALVYEVKGLDDDDQDTLSKLLFIKADSDEAYEELHRIYREEGVEEEEITETFYEFEQEEMADSCERTGFSKDARESEVVRITLKDACGFDFVNRIKKMPDYIIKLGKLSVTEYRAGVKNCVFNGQNGILEDLSYLSMSWFDTEISSCTITDDEVNGFFFVRTTPSGVIIPVLLYAYGADYIKNIALMIANSVKEAEKKYPPETEIVIHRSRKASAELIKRLLPGVKGKPAFFGERMEN